jgi:hypothetical protein
MTCLVNLKLTLLPLEVLLCAYTISADVIHRAGPSGHDLSARSRSLRETTRQDLLCIK